MNFHSIRIGGARSGVVALAAACTAVLLSAPAFAQREARHGSVLVVRSGPGWHGDIARFHEHDWGLWRGGRWVHQAHGGRMGWWWVVGGVWYFYPSPIYPYPSPWEPPPTFLVTPRAGPVPPAPPTQYWYLCEASKTYYPYVATCPGGWKQVPAVPPDVTASPSK
jgi:hypothetical protein